MDLARLSWAELLGRECADLARAACTALGALACGDLAAGKLEADAAPGGNATDVKAAVQVTVKMARCKVRATVMAVSPLVVAQARAMPGPEPKDRRLT
ncbi:MAG TPA: hypothetical protein VN786_02665 [Acidimicrobiales bacterium]|nr:hypothetical protein [Acidimicrobiales bacterium]